MRQVHIKLEDISAYRLGGGYLIEASRQRVQIEEAMRHSRHMSVSLAARYYDSEKLEDGKAAWSEGSLVPVLCLKGVMPSVDAAAAKFGQTQDANRHSVHRRTLVVRD